MNQIAVIADVHGNMAALEVVLADIQQRDIRLVYNLGDLIGKGPSSDQVVDRCREVCQVIVRGNWDDSIARSTDNSPFAADAWYRAQLGEARLAYLRHLPNSHDFRLSGQNIRLYHASAQGEYHRVHPWSGQEALQAMFDNTPFTGMDGPLPEIAIYGDIHAPYMLPVDVGGRTRILLNAGSVGNPLDIPLASYLILRGVLESETPAPFSIDFVRLPYDIEAAIQQAQQAALPELEAYSAELRTAIYRRRQKPG